MRSVVLMVSLLFALQPLRLDADPLFSKLNQYLDDPTLSGGIFGVMVQRYDDSRVYYARNLDTRLMPASNRKLITAAVALETLGDNFTIKTDVLADASPDSDGILHGGIYLRGGGDGLLSVDDLDAMAKKIAASGAKQIEGAVVGDGSLFSDGPYGEGWGWDFLPESDAPQISGLEANEGVIKVTVSAGAQAGDPVSVWYDPPVDYVQAKVDAVTVDDHAADDTVKIARRWNSNTVDITGSIAVGHTESETVSVDNPALFAAMLFAESLKRAGVDVTQPADVGKTPSTASTLLARHTSEPLSGYLAKMLKPSDNLLAESVVRLVGLTAGGAATYRAGNTVEMAFLKKHGIDTSRVTLADGSGVSRRNFVTSRSIIQLLGAMHLMPDWKVYANDLPVAGVDGTLKNRMRGTPAAGTVMAKTGTLTAASCLSGYLTSPSKRLYLFSILMNNYVGTAEDARRVQDTMVEYMVRNLP